jgi:hypothetical protein
MQKLGFIIAIILVTGLHFFLTFVVALFLLSTLNIVNQDILHIEKLYYAEVTVSAVIFIISGFIYFRGFRKITMFLKINFFRDLLP